MEIPSVGISSWADSTVGWVSDSVTHAGIGFRFSTATYGVLRLIATAYLAVSAVPCPVRSILRVFTKNWTLNAPHPWAASVTPLLPACR